MGGRIPLVPITQRRATGAMAQTEAGVEQAQSTGTEIICHVRFAAHNRLKPDIAPCPFCVLPDSCTAANSISNPPSYESARSILRGPLMMQLPFFRLI